jgi:hypothetical protein
MMALSLSNRAISNLFRSALFSHARCRLSCLLIISVFLAFGSRAQVNLHKGYVVMNSLDTLRGYIDQKEWTRNPGTLSFYKSTDDGTPRDFGIRDIVYFQVDDKLAYQRYAVSISMDKVSLENLGPPQEKSETDTVFSEEKISFEDRC